MENSKLGDGLLVSDRGGSGSEEPLLHAIDMEALRQQFAELQAKNDAGDCDLHDSSGKDPVGAVIPVSEKRAIEMANGLVHKAHDNFLPLAFAYATYLYGGTDQEDCGSDETYCIKQQDYESNWGVLYLWMQILIGLEFRSGFQTLQGYSRESQSSQRIMDLAACVSRYYKATGFGDRENGLQDEVRTIAEGYKGKAEDFKKGYAALWAFFTIALLIPYITPGSDLAKDGDGVMLAYGGAMLPRFLNVIFWVIDKLMRPNKVSDAEIIDRALKRFCDALGSYLFDAALVPQVIANSEIGKILDGHVGDPNAEHYSSCSIGDILSTTSGTTSETKKEVTDSLCDLYYNGETSSSILDDFISNIAKFSYSEPRKTNDLFDRCLNSINARIESFLTINQDDDFDSQFSEYLASTKINLQKAFTQRLVAVVLASDTCGNDLKGYVSEKYSRVVDAILEQSADNGVAEEKADIEAWSQYSAAPIGKAFVCGVLGVATHPSEFDPGKTPQQTASKSLVGNRANLSGLFAKVELAQEQQSDSNGAGAGSNNALPKKGKGKGKGKPDDQGQGSRMSANPSS